MKNIKWIALCLLIICMIVMIPFASATELDLKHNHPDFPREFLVIIGRYTFVNKSNQNDFKQSLIIQCNRGKILIIGGAWARATQYGSWVYRPFISVKVTYIKAPCFYGFYHNNRICGITLGDWYISQE